MTRGQVCLRRGEERKLLAGSNWIFDNQIDWVDQFCADGSVVEVLDSRQRPMGLGFFQRPLQDRRADADARRQ